MDRLASIEVLVAVADAGSLSAAARRLGMPIANVDGSVIDRAELGVGDDADTGFLDSTIGLVWRSLVLYLLMLLLLGIAKAMS